MALKTSDVLRRLQDFDFSKLFIEELGWSNPISRRPETIQVNGDTYERLEIADLGGAKVFQIISPDGDIPDQKRRNAIRQEISKHYHENLLIFVDDERSQTYWHWAKREDGRAVSREHPYFKGQPGDLFLSKISGLFFDISEFDEDGKISVVEVARRLKDALDVEQVTKKFYEEYRVERLRFAERIRGIGDERDQIWYTSVLLNRLMFVYFLQQKFFLDGGNNRYLQDKLDESRAQGNDLFYQEFLSKLFFKGLAQPKDERKPETRQAIGDVPYLGGSIFMRHEVEQRWDDIEIPDAAFDGVLSLFTRWSWNLDDTRGGDAKTINPDVLGYIFEKYINQKAFGAYYTPTEITQYLCEQTIHRLILDRVNTPEIPGIAPARHFDNVADLLMHLDSRMCRELLNEILPSLTLLDPACGSGAFLIAALNTLVDIYAGVLGRIDFVGDEDLQRWLKGIHRQHDSINYYVKKKIISENLYGVDIMPEAVEIAELRLYLALVSSVGRPEQLEPLPNIDFNLLTGNSLIGLLRVNEERYNSRYSQMDLFRKPYRVLVDEKNRLVSAYRDATGYTDNLEAMRAEIDKHRDEANQNLNQLLLQEWSHDLGIKYEEATWDLKKNKAGRSKKRALRLEDIEDLQPFHWGYEFDAIMNQRGGFDAIITNPPWEVWQTDEKEFFQQFAPDLQKNKIRIEEWKQQQNSLMQDPDVRAAWLKYASRFPHTSKFFKSAPQYENQASYIDGKKVPSKTNLYAYFLEQCFNLLHVGGHCGIVIPSGIYTDLGSMQLRKMLFEQVQITGLFGFENRKHVFEGVDSRFKFVVLTFGKGGETEHFPAVFMRHDVEEIDQFPEQLGLEIAVPLIERLSPDSLSIMEFKNDLDVQIAEKMLRFPLLGEHLDDTWNLSLTQELNMTSDSNLFQTEPAPGRLPLYEGKMIHQFTHQWAEPRYWVDEQQGRARILRRVQDKGQRIDYQAFRIGYRDIARNTDSRTLISSVIPPTMHGNKLPTAEVFDDAGNVILPEPIHLLLAGIWNSFAVDFMLRMKVTSTVNFFYIFQLPVPRLQASDPEFRPIVDRAARLICTTPEFDDLAREVGLRGHEDGATVAGERAKLRAELDGMIAHLYGLTEDEFAYILTTFPLVDRRTKDAALEEYRSLAPSPDDAQLAALIQAGESPRLEFKSAFAWNRYRSHKDGTLKEPIIQAVAGFLNSPEGGAVVIGVEDDGTIHGLADDYSATNAQRPGRDTYELALRSAMGDRLGGNVMNNISITFHVIDGAEVCRVSVQPASDPVFLGGDLYIRDGNKKRKLSVQEAIAYQRTRWSTP